MIRKNFWLSNDQVRFLRKLEGTMTEHIRRAIDIYIESKKMLKVSISPSKYGKSSNKE